MFLAATLTASGCVTSLGYVPENIKLRVLEADDTSKATLTPTYRQVKEWAYDVQDALGTRATTNRYASSFGALFGLASAGALAGLAIFAPGSAAISGIPLGGGFLSGAATIYSNDFRADMYSRAATYVKELINVSDERLSATNHVTEARCLKREVDKVLRRVARIVTMAQPTNLAAALAAVKEGDDEVAKLIKVARGDLSDLDFKGDELRTNYCS